MKNLKISDDERHQIRQMHESYRTKGIIVSEQSVDKQEMMYIQQFLNKHPKIKSNLNVDGMAGKETEKAIQKYQMLLGVLPADGVWGEKTQTAMPVEDKRLLDDIKSGDTLIGKAKSFLGFK